MAENQLQTLFRRYADEGDLAALGALFDAAAPGLLRVARRLARSPEAAEDAVQEVFLTIVEQPGSYDRSRPLGPWLVGVLAHRVQSGRRRDARTPEVDRLPTREEPEPVDVLRGIELEESVRSALDALPENERIAVASRLFDHVGGKELAQRLGISAGAARIRLHRGLTKLRALVPVGVAAALAGGGGRAHALSAMRGRVLEAAGGASSGAVKAAGAWSATWALGLGAAVVSVGAWALLRAPDPPSDEAATELALREDQTARTSGGAAPVRSESARSEIARAADAAPAQNAYRVRTVSALDGEPVEDVEITLARYLGASEYEESPAVRSDAQGRATLPIPEGWDIRRITAWPTATTGWSRTFTIGLSDAQRAEEITLELAGGGTFEGRVVEVDGRAIAGANVRGWCSSRIEGPPARTTTSGPDGTFRIEHLGPEFYVDAQKEGHAIRSGFAGKLRTGETAEELEIVLDRAATLRGVVTDLEGRPLEGVKIRSDPDYGSLAQWDQTRYPEIRKVTGLRFRATTDGTGSFEVAPVPAGRTTRLHLRATGFLEAYRDLDPAEVAHQIELDPGLSAEGVVFEASGAPAAGAVVRRGPYFSNVHTAPERVVTDANGRFRLEGFSRPDPNDEYEAPPYVVVLHEGHAVHVEQPIELGPGAATVSVRLDAERRLAGRVVDTDGAPVEGASLRLTGERRVNRGFTTDIPPSWVHVARIDDTTSDADGRFAFEQLPDGPYELQLFALGDRRRSRSFDVAGGDEDLELVLDDRAMDKVVLRGRVTDARTGEPLDRFTVCPITDDSGMNREFVDPNGQYEITGLDEGRYSVVFSADGYSKFETDEAKYEEGRHEVDAALWPEATLRFAVVDENGELLQGAVLRAFDLDGEPLSIGTPRSSSRNRKALDGRGVAHGLPSRPITVEVEWRGDVARHAIDLTNPIDDEVELSIARTPEPVLGRVELLVLTDDANPVDLRRRFEAIRSERDMEGLAEFMGTALESAPSQPVSLVFSSDAHRRRLTATVKPLPSGEFEITESQTDGLSGFAGPSMSSTTSYSAPVPALSLRMPIGSWRVEIQRDGETVATRSVEVTEPASATQEIDPDDPWSGIPDVHFVTLPAPR